MARGMTRRHLVYATSAGALGLAADWSRLPYELARLALEPASTSASTGFADEVEARVDGVLQAYDAQGAHRTGTDVDRLSGEWLREQASRAGARARLETFPLDRLDVRQAFVEIGGRRIEGLPFFDAGSTAAAGIAAPIGPSGIHVAIADAASISTEGEFLADVRRKGQARAIVVVTAAGVPGLVPSNARHFANPYGCPVLQVAAAPAQELLAQAQSSGEPVRVVCESARASTNAANVVADVPGRDPARAPVVVITPRSGWWYCASERGGGIACWLETLRAVTNARPARRVLCLASSGHELGHLGLEAFLHAEAELVKGRTPGSTSAPISAPGRRDRRLSACGFRPRTMSWIGLSAERSPQPARQWPTVCPAAGSRQGRPGTSTSAARGTSRCWGKATAGSITPVTDIRQRLERRWSPAMPERWQKASPNWHRCSKLYRDGQPGRQVHAAAGAELR